MATEIIYQLTELVNSLKSSNNNSEDFFSKLRDEIEINGLGKITRDKIINCFSISQYANFNYKQEQMLSKLISSTTDRTVNTELNWTDNSILLNYSEYTPCKDIFQAVCDELGKHYTNNGFKYSRSRPKITYKDSTIKLNIAFWSSGSNTPGKYVNLEILPSFYSTELEKESPKNGYLFGFTDILEEKHTNDKSKIRVNQIYGDVLDRIDGYSSESVIKNNNNCNVYGIDKIKFNKIIQFIDEKIIRWIDKMKSEKGIIYFLENATESTKWSLIANEENSNSKFTKFVKLKYPDIDLTK